ncbi:MAG TPA: glycosyltransferase family 4 protein [Gammaproteobacteria bacterium]
MSDEVLEKIRQTVVCSEKQTLFLYLGALRPIRGFDALLKAFPEVVKKNLHAKLLVLARGANDEKCADYMREFQQQGIAENVSIIGGWLEKDEVRAYIEISDIVVLPFVLVPSDIPIAALEALARAKPVIVSNVDGLPELAQGRGLVIDPLDKDEFASCMSDIAGDEKSLIKYQQAANDYMTSYPRWADVGNLMDKICSKYR